MLVADGAKNHLERRDGGPDGRRRKGFARARMRESSGVPSDSARGPSGTRRESFASRPGAGVARTRLSLENRCIRETPGDALEIGKHAVSSFCVQTSKRGGKEMIVGHRANSPSGEMPSGALS